jgi:tetratricopeptide (TPR) repeat protein
VYCRVGQTSVCPKCAKRRSACLAAVALILSGCSHNAAPSPGRIAVLRFENLTPDVTLDWMGRAASDIIAREISTGQNSVIFHAALHSNPLAQNRPISVPGQSTESSAAIADGATRLVMGQISLVRDHLTLDVTERDAATGKTIKSFSLAARDSGHLYDLADAAAHQLSSQVTPFDSHNDQAIAAWSRANETTDYAASSAEYARAAQADPNFASAWLAWAGNTAAHGDRAAAARIVAEAQRHAGSFNSVDRTRLQLVSAELNGDRAASLAALNEIGRLLPDDVDYARTIGDQNFNARQFPSAIAAYRRVARLAPNDGLVWNQLGYSLMYSGDYDGAMSALQTYRRLSPGDVNPIDSQGDVAFSFGRFSDAEKLYQQAAARDPAFQNSADLLKAAMARLMTGDVAGADKEFDKYAAARRIAKDEMLPFRSAQWRFLSGRHDEALSALTNLVTNPDPQFQAPQFKAMVLTEMAVWELQLGHRDRALKNSLDALKSGGASASTLITRFAAENAKTAEEWSALADRMLGNPQLARMRPIVLAYALFMSQQWQAAEPLWKKLFDESGPDDSITPVIYGQILVALNRPRDAEPYLRLFPDVRTNGVMEFLSLAIPRILDARAAVLASQGKNAEADTSRKVFKTLWGGA